MTSVNRNNLILQNNAPIYNDQRTILGSTIENIAPPSYEEVINPNGTCYFNISMISYIFSLFYIHLVVGFNQYSFLLLSL